MTDELYNHYIQLINKRYNYDISNMTRYGLIMKLMSWQYNNRPYHNNEEVV